VDDELLELVELHPQVDDELLELVELHPQVDDELLDELFQASMSHAYDASTFSVPALIRVSTYSISSHVSTSLISQYEFVFATLDHKKY
jgi:hypothetical protein